MTSVNNYFSTLPQEINLVIFQLLSDLQSLLNFSEAVGLNVTLSNGNTWKSIFANKFPGIDLSIIIGINYSSKDYLEYMFIYEKLLNSWKYATGDIKKVRDHMYNELKIDYPDYYEQLNNNLDFELPQDVIDTINDDIRVYKFSFPGIIIYRVLYPNIRTLLLEFWKDKSMYKYDREITLVIALDDLILTVVNGNNSFDIGINNDQMVTFLMYTNYHNIYQIF